MAEIDHAHYQKKVKDLPMDTLLWIIQDCAECLQNYPDGPKAGIYQDEIHYCAMELKRRREAV